MLERRRFMRKPPESEKIYVIVGHRMARRRLEVGTSQTELANRCNLARGTIANIEGARQRPTLHTLFSIAEALDVDLQALLPTRSEVEQYSGNVDQPLLSARMKRVAGGSAAEVEDFIASRMQRDEPDAQPHRD